MCQTSCSPLSCKVSCWFLFYIMPSFYLIWVSSSEYQACRAEYSQRKWLHCVGHAGDSLDVFFFTVPISHIRPEVLEILHLFQSSSSWCWGMLADCGCRLEHCLFNTYVPWKCSDAAWESIHEHKSMLKGFSRGNKKSNVLHLSSKERTLYVVSLQVDFL